MSLTLDCDKAVVARIEAFRKKRNISDYECAGNVSSHEAEQVFVLATDLRKRLLDWLQVKHPGLLG